MTLSFSGRGLEDTRGGSCLNLKLFVKHPELLQAGFKRNSELRDLQNQIQIRQERDQEFLNFSYRLDELFNGDGIQSCFGFEQVLARLPLKVFGDETAPFILALGKKGFIFLDKSLDYIDLELNQERFKDFLAWANKDQLTSCSDLVNIVKISLEKDLQDILSRPVSI